MSLKTVTLPVFAEQDKINDTIAVRNSTGEHILAHHSTSYDSELKFRTEVQYKTAQFSTVRSSKGGSCALDRPMCGCLIVQHIHEMGIQTSAIPPRRQLL